MAHQRHASAADALKAPHSVSLKVLRLSRPSLATQYPLPASQALGIAPTASLAYPSSRTADKFILSPVLNLPEAFGSAYVGENFSCTLCANNEIEPGNASKAISGVRIQADMQTPSVPGGTSLELFGHERSEEGEDPKGSDGDISPGASLQKILRFELKEEGNHVLAVTVTYTETALAGEGRPAPTGGKVRTFRKLYQFVAQQLLSVRTKAGEVAPGRHLLEAQLENMGEGAVSLEDVSVNPNELYKGTSLNWDLDGEGQGKDKVKPVLMAREVIQVAFLLEEKGEREGVAEGRRDQLGDNRRVLGQLEIKWRTALGDRGTLSTGWLTARR
ncbi:uncharacterized protein CC84DRAFT_1118043 [Paraphaeosphaeria sporulosa]|uniref:DUF974 domain-containing protein n=1 Tax=Paraphaeosphaeria sporulosa TaxID=1460663 RepID=A0A177CL53_9PLEO|nr:uncharacterized protein CC84DRAFT_1118043 [Paraphaeosphaeria sporulosa]OAG07598.1 hypothetical protein CC84DRAFT_1118043 [Paraphaeosphaeria sporulosa]